MRTKETKLAVVQKTIDFKAEGKKLLWVTLGTLILAAGVYFFKFPNNFSTGGVSGISILFGKIIPSLSPAVTMWVINAALLVVGFLFFGKGFGVLTAYCSMIYSFFTWLFEKVYPMTQPFTDQPFLELCFAMALPAVGSAILFNWNASSGGTDIVAMILKKYTSLDIGKALLVSDAVIAVSACFVFDIKTGMFSILGLIIKAFVVDSVIESINLCKFFTIVTTHPDEVNNYIIQHMNRTSTVMTGEGSYTHDPKTIILVACKRSEAIKLRSYIYSVDRKAFMFITNTSEIIGKGFRSV